MKLYLSLLISLFLNTSLLAQARPELQPDPEDDGILKILAIGNSFSQDAVEQYLYELAAAEGVSMVIGNLYIGGASLDRHLTNSKENAAAYEYRKIAQDGKKTNQPGTSIESGVTDENWDYISFQQVSGHSGRYETFVVALPALVDYVKGLNPHPNTNYILHQTWAYEATSTHSSFPNYNNDQEAMYRAIVETYEKVSKLTGMRVIPAGTAIQNGRNSIIGDNFTRDGYHLDLGIGRYTAACTWFEALTGIDVVGNSFKPEALTDLETRIAQHCAHAAVISPGRITPLEIKAPATTEP